MNHIKSIVSDIIKITSPEQNWKNTIMQSWCDIIGPLASKVFIERIYQDTIILAVTDSCWMQELHVLSDIILTKINQTIHEQKIKTIRFKYAPKQKSRIQTNKKNVPLICKPKQLSSNEQEALKKIKDPELSQALMRFLQKCHQSS